MVPWATLLLCSPAELPPRSRRWCGLTGDCPESAVQPLSPGSSVLIYKMVSGLGQWFVKLLGWPEYSFGFFHRRVQKNLDRLFGQPSI